MMNGFNQQPHYEGDDMAKKRNAPPVPKWTDEERELGDQLIADSATFSGSFIEKFGHAAKGRGYTLYTNVPQSVRNYVQYILKEIAANEASIDEAIKEARGGNMTTEERWLSEVDPSTLPPEDDRLRQDLLQQRRTTQK
jgi:hypothetical protein